jgi:large subunit ribosomal protein L15
MRIDDVNRGVHRNKKRKRVGRGPGSGHGKTSGRGHKGQGQLAGWSASPIFEGARMPIIRQIPKRGFHNRFARTVFAVNVGALAAAFPAGTEVTPEVVRKAGLAGGTWDALKILGNGEITHALTVSAHHFSRQAREKILAAGGSVTELPGPAPVKRGEKKQRKAGSSGKPAAG